MGKRGRILMVLIATVGLLFGSALLTKPGEPSCQGHSLSEWIMIHYESDRPGRSQAQRAAAAGSIRELGTNSLPRLVEWIQYETPSWHRVLFGTLPRSVALRVGNSRPARATLYRRYHRAEAALVTFRLLGSNAVDAVPELERLARDSAHPQTARRALAALSQVRGNPPINAGTSR